VAFIRRTERWALGAVQRLDAWCTALYGWRYHPLHQSGAVAIALFVVLLVTGLYLLLFYRVGSPWASVAGMTADPWLGRWIRSLHRYASDAMVGAILLHALRMFAQGRSWGPRVLAWTSGVVLLGVVFICGWTGYVMVWDAFGARLADVGARLFDALPILSEPTRRIFAGEREIPGAFFFINLFLHVALPLAMAAGLWLHVAHLARPVLWPPRPLAWVLIGGLTLLSVVAPAAIDPEASPFTLAERVRVDLFYAFWLPVAERWPPWVAWTGAVLTLGVALLVPRLTRRPRIDAMAPSQVDEHICTGCAQCPQDCPWDAITMVERTDGRETLVARVNPADCVSCGICAASCAPMGVGPPGRSGRDQLAELRERVATSRGDGAEIVAICCRDAAPEHLDPLRRAGAEVQTVACTGNLHTSVIELTLRAGAAGVIVFSCPTRDCRGREGPKWLAERVFRDREAELQARVDRRRVRLAVMARGDLAGTLSALRAFDDALRQHGLGGGEGADLAVDLVCEPVSSAARATGDQR
jgi:ferredoxin